MKPKVLISAPSQGENNYTEAFSNFGFSVTSQYLPKYDSGYDALVLSGGGDIAPELYGEQEECVIDADIKRDECEISLVEYFTSANKAVLGICRGIQLINVALGGTLCQNITNSHLHRSLPDSSDNLHLVQNAENTFAHRLWGEYSFVNSAHHQCCRCVPSCVSVCQVSADGVIEALCDFNKIIAVQWHPERMVLKHKRSRYSDASLLFEYFKNLI